MKIAGILLIVAGIAAVIYGGFSYTTHKRAVDMGPVQINTTEQHRVPISPILGVAGILGGRRVALFSDQKGPVEQLSKAPGLCRRCAMPGCAEVRTA